MINPKDDLDAVRNICDMLNSFNTEEKIRILRWSIEKLNLKSSNDLLESKFNSDPITHTSAQKIVSIDSGIHESAIRWLSRVNILEEVLEESFSIGLDDFDVVAKKIPGNSNKEKIKNIFLLTGIASFLKTGLSSFTHEKVRETCIHYGVWDMNNFNNYLKTFVGDLKGDKSSGYTLTSKGLNQGADLVKSIGSEK